MEEGREDPFLFNGSNDGTECSNIEIRESDSLDFPSSFDWDESDIPVNFWSDRETLLNAQPVASNERELEENFEVFTSYSLAIAQNTVVADTEENSSNFFREDVSSGPEENFQNNLSASSNSLGNKNFGNFAEKNSFEKQVPHETSGTFHLYSGDPLGIVPFDSFVSAQRRGEEYYLNPGPISDNEFLNADLTLQNRDRCHYSGYMSQDRPTINDRKRRISFKSSPDKRKRHPGYSRVLKTDYTVKTSAVGSDHQNRCMDYIEKNRIVNGCTNAENENNEEPQLSGNTHAPSASEHSRINTDSVHSKNLGSGKNHKGYSYAGGKSFKCEVCGKLYSSKGILNKHLRIHTGDKPFECTFCEMRFVMKCDLKRHLRIHAGEKPFKCKFCERGFRQNSHLQRHLRIHAGEKPFKCKFCEKEFRQNSHLQRHLRIHTGDKPFECEFCKKRFTQKIGLQRHLLTHSEKKGVKCEQCGKSYSSNDQLEAHLKTTLKRSNRCHICRKSFESRCSLNKHRQMHWGQKTAVCEFCKKGFAYKIYLRKHIQICPKKRPFKCNKCGEEFANENDLENHIRTHNPI